MWLDLMTPDAEKARAFYGELFGWTFKIGTPEMGYYTMAQIKGRNAAGIGQPPPGTPFPTAWNTYFGVDDMDATIARIKKNGGQVVTEPMDVMQEGRLAFCMDSTGAAFGLWQPKNHRGAQVVDEPGAMTWHEVYTRDAARTRDFYKAVFGLEARKMEGEGMEYWTLHQGAKTAGGLFLMGKDFPAEISPHWMNCFAVSDTDAAVKTVKRMGGKVLKEPMDTPYGRFAVVMDPAGAPFSIMKLSPLAMQQA
jgi:predicted enzyme related to lactoylglutathione lyase